MAVYGDRGQTRIGPLAVVVALVIGVLAGWLVFTLRRPAPEVDVTVSPPPAPQFDPAAIGPEMDAGTRAAFLDYARSLTYESQKEFTDAQRLMVLEDSVPRYGPLVSIEPQAGVAALTLDELAQGRVVAQFVNRDGSGEGYPKLAVPAGQRRAFWWMRRNAEGRWRAVLVPDDTAAPVVERAARYDYHPDYRWNHPRALWLWDDADERAWTTCSRSGCCELLDGREVDSEM